MKQKIHNKNFTKHPLTLNTVREESMSERLKKSECFAEVVQSSLEGWTAQSWVWDKFPEFGTLVAVETKKRTLFGIVHQIQTGSFDGNRAPFAYGKTEGELRAEQPQIFEFLQTTFSCLTLGFVQHEVLSYQLAPEPPKIHAFVSPLKEAEYRQFFSSDNYLPLIFSSSHLFNVDELLLALLQTMHSQKLLKKKVLASFIENFSLLTGSDYRRLKLFLKRAEKFASSLS